MDDITCNLKFMAFYTFIYPNSLPLEAETRKKKGGGEVESEDREMREKKRGRKWGERKREREGGKIKK